MRDRFKIHNAPDTIWLVYGDIEQDCNHGDCDEVTWCTAPQYEADIEYIRASEVAGDKAELAALRVEVERLQARCAEAEERAVQWESRALALFWGNDAARMTAGEVRKATETIDALIRADAKP